MWKVQTEIQDILGLSFFLLLFRCASGAYSRPPISPVSAVLGCAALSGQIWLLCVARLRLLRFGAILRL